MPAELWLEAASGGVPGAPAEVAPVLAVRFSAADHLVIDATAPIEQPGEDVLTYERWLRLWCEEPPPNFLKNLKLWREGPPIRGVSEAWGTAQSYEPPVQTRRHATYPFGDAPHVLDITTLWTTGQVGPWIVLQWQLSPRVIPGPQTEITYRISIDEY